MLLLFMFVVVFPVLVGGVSFLAMLVSAATAAPVGTLREQREDGSPASVDNPHAAAPSIQPRHRAA
jgi:hypothetical protein